MCVFRGITLNEALDLLEDENKPFNLFVEPPDVAELTDEVSGEEDFCVTNLTGSQLRAAAEIRYRKQHDEPDPERAETSNQASSSDKCPPTKSKKVYPTTSDFSWSTDQGNSKGSPIFPEANYSKYRDFSPREMFELFFDESLFDPIVEQSNLYCQSTNISAPPVTKDEIKFFFAILIVSGYAQLPSKALFWNSNDDLRNNAVYMAMRRNRFDHIMRILHFSDNIEINPDDKYTKLRPLISSLQQKFMLHFVSSQHIFHDEAMVEYFGKHSCKQAIRNKPIRFGYNVWCQNNPSGYLLSFDPYQGKTYSGNLEEEEKFGKCSATVLHLLRNYSNDKVNLPYTFYYDNLFTTLPFAHELLKRGYNSVGTIRQNRMETIVRQKM